MRAFAFVCALIGLAGVGASSARSQSYAIVWYTIDGGGTMSAGAGAFTLSGTIGQCDAGTEMAAGPYTLTGGFWAGIGVGVPGDCDGDGDVDLSDHDALVSCLTGPGGGLASPSCACFDLDASGDVDLFDFANFQVAFNPAP